MDLHGFRRDRKVITGEDLILGSTRTEWVLEYILVPRIRSSSVMTFWFSWSNFSPKREFRRDTVPGIPVKIFLRHHDQGLERS